MQRKPTREGMVNERISINIHLRTSTDQTSTVKSGSKYDSPFQYFCISFFYISVLLYVCISVFQTERETNTFLRPIPVRPSAVRSGSNDIPGRLSRFLFRFHQLKILCLHSIEIQKEKFQIQGLRNHECHPEIEYKLKLRH